MQSALCYVPLQVKDPSLLRFMVDLRGADLSDKQLRDDLMTMLIAGHETTAAVLTWALFLLMQHPNSQEKAVEEIAQALPDLGRDELGESCKSPCLSETWQRGENAPNATVRCALLEGQSCWWQGSFFKCICQRA